MKKDKMLQLWIQENSWAKPYCIYCTLKAKNGEASWKDTGEVSKSPKGMVIQNGVYVAM